jgi:putative hemolysin
MLSLPTELLILVLLALANGFFSMAETAVVSARKTKLRQLAAKGHAGAVRASALAEHPARFLALVQLWLTLATLVAGAIGGLGLTGQVAARLVRITSLTPDEAWALSAVFVTLGLAVFLVLFGELVPKRIALAHPEKVAIVLSGAIRGPTILAAPLLSGLEAVTDAILRLIRLRPRPAAEGVSDDEVRALVEQGLHAGVFQRAEKEMVEGVLALDQLRVTALMTPRPKIVFLNLDDPEETNWRKIVTSGHSYFPVFQHDRDQIVGMVAVKALWAHSAIGLPTTLKNLLVRPLLVPETMLASQLLEKFKSEGKHIAVVKDEFGAVQGLVTLIDVFEAIVGELPEQGRPNEPAAKRQEDGSWLLDAALPTSELKSVLGLEIPLPQEREAEFQTVGGFVVTQFGRIPAVGDRYEWGGWRFEVTAMDRHRVDKIRVVRLEPEKAPEAAES